MRATENRAVAFEMIRWPFGCRDITLDDSKNDLKPQTLCDFYSGGRHLGFMCRPRQAGPRAWFGPLNLHAESARCPNPFWIRCWSACHFRGMRLDPNPGHRDLAESVCQQCATLHYRPVRFRLERVLAWRQQRSLTPLDKLRIADVTSVQQDRAVSLAAHWSQNGIPAVRLLRYEASGYLYPLRRLMHRVQFRRGHTNTLSTPQQQSNVHALAASTLFPHSRPHHSGIPRQPAISVPPRHFCMLTSVRCGAATGCGTGSLSTAHPNCVTLGPTQAHTSHMCNPPHWRVCQTPAQLDKGNRLQVNQKG